MYGISTLHLLQHITHNSCRKLLPCCLLLRACSVLLLCHTGLQVQDLP